MKKLILFGILVLFGCNKVVVPPVSPIPVPGIITERENGSTFVVKAGSSIKFVLNVDQSDDYFWAISQMEGDFEVVSETRSRTTQTFIVKVNSGGKLGLQYCQFAPDGRKVLSQLFFGVALDTQTKVS